MNQRTAQQIKRDMLKWALDHLNIRVSDEFGYDTIEADPLVHLLIGACASEAKLVYDVIQDSDDRLQQRLLRYLLPEAFHFPAPAFAIAKAQPTSSTCHISNTNHFVFRDGEQVFKFTPLFNTTLLNGKVRFVCTDSNIIEIGDQPNYTIEDKVETVNKFLLGIETKQKITSLENISFYFNWRGSITEKQALLLALSGSQWYWNDQLLQRRVGLMADAADWEDSFDIERQLMHRVSAQFRLNFSVITDTKEQMMLDVSVQKMLRAWHQQQVQNEEDNNTNPKWDSIKGNFVWLHIQLPYALQMTDIERNLSIELNHFPVVNRELKIKDDAQTLFTRSAGMGAVAIQPPKGLFCGIKEVKNYETGAILPPVSMATLLGKDRNSPAWTLRYGGTGRTDTLNAWERLFTMMSVFREEQRDREAIENLGIKMTLEELYEALAANVMKGKKDDSTKINPIEIYVFVRPGSQAAMRAEIKYWLTDGEAANNFKPGKNLIAEPAIPGLDPLSIKLISTTQEGKSSRSTIEMTRNLQDALFRRGRVVSANDVKSLCRTIMGDRLTGVNLKPVFETDRNPNGGIRRAIEVALTVKDPEDTFTQQLAQEIEWNLQENSIGTIPYTVYLHR